MKRLPEIRVATAGGPPSNWMDLAVWDLDANAEVKYCVTVDCDNGWAEVIDLAASSRAHTDVHRFVYGNFELRLREEHD